MNQPRRSAPEAPPPPDSRLPVAGRVPAGRRPGSRLVLALIALAVGLAAFAVWFQWQQTRRCLAFYGPRAARHIQSAPRVELWQFDGSSERPRRRLDVSTARGLVHLRRGLVEDANFAWFPGSEPRPTGNQAPWEAALAFFESSTAETPDTLLLVDISGSGDRGGRIAVAGRPGAAGLGRLQNGLRLWIGEILGADGR